MMRKTAVKRRVLDAVARSDKPQYRTYELPTMTVEGGTTQRVPHIQAPKLAPFGSTVLSATLRLVQAGAADSGNRTLSLRRITETWSDAKLTWANRPSRTSVVSASTTVPGAGTDGRVIEFDITSDIQAFADGALKNFGWTIESGNGNKVSFYTRNSTSIREPIIEVAWANRPQPPTDLVPSGGGVISVPKPKLAWHFTDKGGTDGNQKIGAAHIKLATGLAGWTAAGGFDSPVYDTGVQSLGQSRFDLAGTSWGGLSVGQTVYWTVRHRDLDGLWSQWSDPASFTYQPLTVPTLSNPVGVVNDTTFPWSWTVSSQSRFQVLIRDSNGAEVYDSGIQVHSEQRTFTQEVGVVKPAIDYLAVLRVWDEFYRQATPGAPIYAETTSTFSYVDSGVIAGVANLQAVVASNGSDVVLTWTRSTPPDQFAVWRGGAEHLRIRGTDVQVSSTGYRLVLHDLPPRITHTIAVKAVVNDAASASNPTKDVTTDPIGVRLVDTADPSLYVVLLSEGGEDNVTSDMPEQTYRFEPIGSDVAVEVTSALRWFEGTVQGTLAEYGDLTARGQRAALLTMKATRLVPKVLVWGRNAVPVYISKVNIQDVDPVTERYRVSFAFTSAVASPEYELL